MDTESELFEDLVKTESPESPHIVAPPTCHVEESEGSGRCEMSYDSTAPLSPDHPLTHTTPALVPILRRTASISDLAFRKRVRSSYDSSPSPALLVRKRYSVSEDAEDESPTSKDEDLAARDEGLATGDEGLGMRVKSRGLDDEGHRVENDELSLGEEEEAV
nr:hypothetical protein [Tanacetum cinerariifolium]